MNPNTTYCIFGYGIAGQLLVLELLKRNVSSKEIIIVDENLLGGALITQYGSVLSNTPWWKTKKALSEYSPWCQETIKKGDETYKEDQCMPVRDIGKYCLEVANRASFEVEKIPTHVSSIQYDKQTQVWCIKHSFGTIQSKVLFLAQGAVEKALDLDKPFIPLSIALNKTRLEELVSEKDTIAVFGTSHSGTIVMNILHELKIKTIGIYNTEKPFLFARDGEYDGIKEGSEKIADSILNGSYTNLTLVSWKDPIEIYKTLQRCTKFIYCVGFKASTPALETMPTTYDPKTAKVGNEPNCFGYGIAYPGTTELNGKVYPDVSVLSFQEQICRTLPSILGSS
jgi:hypothetical protein